MASLRAGFAGAELDTAAALAIDAKTSVQAVDYSALRTRLLAAGQKLTWTPPAKPAAKKK
jgi:hypothetical protein